MSRRRKPPRWALAGVLALAAAAIVLPAPSAAFALSSVPTGVLCTTDHAQAQTATVRFGYSNIGPIFENIPPGDSNFFSPPPLDRSQPNQFVTGNGSFDMTLPVGAPPLIWTLNGFTATAEFGAGQLPFERPCPERGPSIGGVAPATVAPGAGPRALTVFGQDLAGAAVSLSGSGVSVGAPTLSTGQRLDATITVAADAAPGPRDVLVTAANGDEVGCRGCLVVDPAASGAAGPRGPAGERGPAGPTGPGVAAVRHLGGRPVALAGRGTTTARAGCPAGSAAISGGYEVTGHGAPRALAVLANHASGTGGWIVSVRARGPRPGQRLLASVTCLDR